MQNHVAIYDVSVGAAYADLLDEVKNLKSIGYGPDMFRKLLAVASGKCGAACSAATKHLIRSVAVEHLITAKEAGLDITPTVAQNMFKRLLGRGVDCREMLFCFATPGRTAANKSTVTADDMATIENHIHASLKSTFEKMADIKLRHRTTYRAAVDAI